MFSKIINIYVAVFIFEGLVYIIAWSAVVRGINSMSNVGTRRSRVKFPALRVLLIPNITANHANMC